MRFTRNGSTRSLLEMDAVHAVSHGSLDAVHGQGRCAVRPSPNALRCSSSRSAWALCRRTKGSDPSASARWAEHVVPAGLPGAVAGRALTSRGSSEDCGRLIHEAASPREAATYAKLCAHVGTAALWPRHEGELWTGVSSSSLPPALSLLS